ncbi:MAG: hypothetical protein JWO36_6054 [Myxococcales bacterium]|nr:hypothetical protein [Myxococcales bacterium]
MKAKTLRIAALVVPSLLVAKIVSMSHGDPILHAAGRPLVMMFMVMAGALVMRLLEMRGPKESEDSSRWDQLDILTPSGIAVAWSAAAALCAARITGWASLSVVGLLGLGIVCTTVIWSTLVAGGTAPWRRATITRAIVPETSVEGDPLREEVRLTSVRIPAGMRLFATGRALRHGATSRYAIGSDGSGADIRLESELGPALRGEHHAPPLVLWLGDILGLTHTPAVYRGEVKFTVMPKVQRIDGVAALRGAGGDDATSQPTYRQPTEGTFRIREYVPGDDTRRIHWVRSVQQNELVVRLPDEVPLAEPSVRLILDTQLHGVESLTCRAADEVLDALVRVWLGIGKSLTEVGSHVTLVAAVENKGSISAVERVMTARSSRQVERLGARVAWQKTVSLQTLVTNSAPRQIVVSSRPRRLPLVKEVVWVLVPEHAWSSSEPAFPDKPFFTLPYPSGVDDNRPARVNRERFRIATMWQDRAVFSQIVCWSEFSGDYVARMTKPGRIGLTVIP